MSKGNSGKSEAPKQPAAPQRQNEYYYQNDILRSQSVYDPRKKGYINTSFSTPQEQDIEKQATGYLNNLMTGLQGAINLSPETIQGYRDAYTQPQIAALNDSYNLAKGQAMQSASGRGLENSVGFANYTANQLEKNRAQGLADIQANAKQLEYDLPNKMLTPYVNQFNLLNAALNGQQANLAQNLEPSFQGRQASNNYEQQNYQNQWNAWQSQQQQQNQGRGGLFSFFTGGV